MNSPFEDEKNARLNAAAKAAKESRRRAELQRGDKNESSRTLEQHLLALDDGSGLVSIFDVLKTIEEWPQSVPSSTRDTLNAPPQLHTGNPKGTAADGALEEVREKAELLDDLREMLGLAPENWFQTYQVVCERIESAPASEPATVADDARTMVLKGAKKRQQNCAHGNERDIRLCCSCCLDEAAALLSATRDKFRALLVALECQEIDRLLTEDVEVLTEIGKEIATAAKLGAPLYRAMPVVDRTRQT